MKGITKKYYLNKKMKLNFNEKFKKITFKIF